MSCALRPLLALLATAILLTGCNGLSFQLGGLDTEVLEGDILRRLETDLPVELERVECPSGIEPRAGDVFVCRVYAFDGSVGTVEVTQVNDEGNVEWELTDVLAPE